MYFQVCSNSAYPQHSGERYRTTGPLVLISETRDRRGYSDKARILPSCAQLQRPNFQTMSTFCMQSACVGRKIYQLIIRGNFAASYRF